MRAVLCPDMCLLAGRIFWGIGVGFGDHCAFICAPLFWLESVHAWFDLSCMDPMHCWALEWAGMLLPETGRCCQCHSPSIAASRQLFCAGALASTNIELHSSDTAAWCMQIQQRWPLQSGVDASTRWCSAAPSQALWSDQPSTLGPMPSSGAGEFLSPWRLSQAVCCSWGKSSALPRLLAAAWSHPW